MLWHSKLHWEMVRWPNLAAMGCGILAPLGSAYTSAANQYEGERSCFCPPPQTLLGISQTCTSFRGFHKFANGKSQKINKSSKSLCNFFIFFLQCTFQIWDLKGQWFLHFLFRISCTSSHSTTTSPRNRSCRWSRPRNHRSRPSRWSLTTSRWSPTKTTPPRRKSRNFRDLKLTSLR